MNTNKCAKVFVLLVAFLIFTAMTSYATVTIKGEVVEIQGSQVKIKYSGEFVPNAGDPVEIGFETGGEFAAVEGEWKIVKASPGFAWAEVKGSAPGTVAAGYLAIIRSPQANLLSAIRSGDHAVVKSLIKAGANVNTVGKNSFQPLGMAASQGHIDIIRTLIKAGADIHWESPRGQTALIYAIYGGHADVVRTLIDAGVDVNTKIKSDKAPRNYQGATPIFVAIKKDNVETLRVLIDAGAKVNVRNKVGATPVMLASQLGDIGPLLVLITEGADVNAKTTNASGGPPPGTTALMAAARKGRLENVQVLIIAGANVTAKNSEGQTAFKYAKKKNKKKIIDILKKPKQSKEASKKGLGRVMIYMVMDMKTDISGMLIRLGVDVNMKEEDGSTALFAAIKTGSVKIVKMLIKAGVDVNAFCDDWGAFPLITAAQRGNREIIRILIQAGAKINQQAKGDEKGEDAGWTALMVAARAGRTDIVSQLLEAGADPKIANKDGKTAIDMAKRKGNKEVLRLLEKQ